MADLVVARTSTTAIRMESSSHYNIRPCFALAGTWRFSSSLVDIRCPQFVARWYYSSAVAVVSVSFVQIMIQVV